MIVNYERSRSNSAITATRDEIKFQTIDGENLSKLAALKNYSPDDMLVSKSLRVTRNFQVFTSAPTTRPYAAFVCSTRDGGRHQSGLLKGEGSGTLYMSPVKKIREAYWPLGVNLREIFFKPPLMGSTANTAVFATPAICLVYIYL